MNSERWQANRELPLILMKLRSLVKRRQTMIESSF